MEKRLCTKHAILQEDTRVVQIGYSGESRRACTTHSQTKPISCCCRFSSFVFYCKSRTEEPTPGRVFKRLNGSWIVSEYRIDVRGTEPSSEPVYHQINATMSPSPKQLSLSEVDVVSGKVLRHLANVTETGYSVFSSSMTLVLPGMNKAVPFRATFSDKQTIVDTILWMLSRSPPSPLTRITWTSR